MSLSLCSTETRLVSNAEIEPICHFQKLRSLTLVGTVGESPPSAVPLDGLSHAMTSSFLPGGLANGQCLVKIAQGCPRLEKLSIGFLGGAMYGSTFSQALSFLKNLRDLR